MVNFKCICVDCGKNLYLRSPNLYLRFTFQCMKVCGPTCRDVEVLNLRLVTHRLEFSGTEC